MAGLADFAGWLGRLAWQAGWLAHTLHFFHGPCPALRRHFVWMAIRGLLAESPLQTCLCGERLQVEDRQRTLDVILAVVAVRGFPVLDGLAPRCNIAPKVIREAEFTCCTCNRAMLSMCLGFGEGREVGLIWVSEADKWKGSVANEQTIASVEQGFPSEPTQQQSVRRRWRWTRRSPYPIGSCLGECRRLTMGKGSLDWCWKERPLPLICHPGACP